MFVWKKKDHIQWVGYLVQIMHFVFKFMSKKDDDDDDDGDDTIENMIYYQIYSIVHYEKENMQKKKRKTANVYLTCWTSDETTEIKSKFGRPRIVRNDGFGRFRQMNRWYWISGSKAV